LRPKISFLREIPGELLWPAVEKLMRRETSPVLKVIKIGRCFLPEVVPVPATRRRINTRLLTYFLAGHRNINSATREEIPTEKTKKSLGEGGKKLTE